jgi:hypothetical protein
MATNSDGKGILDVELSGSSRIKIKTWNNSLSDIGDDTLIPHGSLVYNQVANLSQGDMVYFSGRFASGDLDYIKESSMTESGAMNEPEFIFTFTNVGKQPYALPEKPAPFSNNVSSGEEGSRQQSNNSSIPIDVPAPPDMVTLPSESSNQEAAPAISLTPQQTPSRSGELHYQGSPVPFGEVVVFDNLPKERLKFVFDRSAWDPTIKVNPDGTKKLTLTSVKQGYQTRCDVSWEILE